MSYETITYEKKGRIAYVTINRPEVMNALNAKAHEELNDAWNDFKDDDDVWVGILSGAGERAFCTGNDLKEERRPDPGGAREGAAAVRGDHEPVRLPEADHRRGARLLHRGRVRDRAPRAT